MSQLFLETIWPEFAYVYQIRSHAIPIDLFRMLEYCTDMVYFRYVLDEVMKSQIICVIYMLLIYHFFGSVKLKYNNLHSCVHRPARYSTNVVKFKDMFLLSGSILNGCKCEEYIMIDEG